MMTDAPRLVGRKEAAAYLGIAPGTFSLWVSTHKMPPPVPGTRKWDRKAIDAKLDEISGLTPAEPEEAYDKWTREHGEAQRPTSDYADWKAKKLKRREKYRPQLGLDAKLERILRFMADHPDCDTIDMIPHAGPVTIEWLVEKSAVRLVGTDGHALRYAVTEEGRAELRRLQKWKSLTP
ncbi:hypothetical protein QN219_04925 [Sinorhizobium sp. 7-81]|uniref:helix-turn-helix transcriptional regulator n=1 Tax=Sinorhizobium sp. 8-89 TaxID=3049089 RepID=UPI0024C41365|nr:hypothetical protein [Sinorhizobium sp. 8-89]MDK1489399.1 hypothetical protein [Sinorhizobium sp. 8-89]